MRKLSEGDKQILEAIYQRMRSLYLEEHFILSREAFSKMTFPVATSCWGLLGIVKGESSFELIPTKARRGAPYVVRGHG
jgi:hypothetical protein